MENCSAPKWGCKNPQLVDLPKSRYPIVHLTSLTEKRQCRCSLIAASCCAADTRRTTAFALHGAVRIPSHHAAQGSRTTRTHTHAHATPLVQTRPHADRRTTHDPGNAGKKSNGNASEAWHSRHYRTLAQLAHSYNVYSRHCRTSLHNRTAQAATSPPAPGRSRGSPCGSSQGTERLALPL